MPSVFSMVMGGINTFALLTPYPVFLPYAIKYLRLVSPEVYFIVKIIGP